MRRRHLSLLVLLGLLVTAVAITAAGGAASAANGVSTLLVKGPQASPAGVSAGGGAGPSYSLFSCQVGLSLGQCYDPYQMRTAYGVDSLIGAGYDGKGKTIVIVDAFQSPNIVAQLNYFDSFYGLPSLNGLGGATDPNLGTFTQVAPDGLTPSSPVTRT